MEIEYGNGREVIQLAHANAYVPQCYKTFIHSFDLNTYKFYLPELRPLWENSNFEKFNSWEVLADDLIQWMEQKGRKNVIGVGHSMGAIATWWASMKRPDLFRAVFLIDPVIMAAKIGNMNKWAPFWLKNRYIPIIKIARNRREHGPDLAAVESHLGSKKVYQRFDKKVWKDFLNYALVQKGNQLSLRYPRDWEARVYGTAPNLWPLIKETSVSLTIIKAEYSDVISDQTWDKLQERLPNSQLIEMKGVGHLVPFEKPEDLGKLFQGKFQQRPKEVFYNLK